MTLTEWLISLLFGPAVLVALALFFRNRIGKALDQYFRHILDAKLEGIKHDLKAKGQEIEALRSGPLQIRGQRRAQIDTRKLMAIDQFWGAVNSLGPLKPISAMMAVFKWDEFVTELDRNPDARERIQKMIASIGVPEFPKHEAHAARPFISPLAWALFRAYQTALGYGFAQYQVLRTGVPGDVLNKPEAVSQVLVGAIPDWKERIEQHGTAIYPYVIEELENRLVLELQRSLEGVEDDEQEVEHASKIIDLVREYDVKQETATASQATENLQQR